MNDSSGAEPAAGAGSQRAAGETLREAQVPFPAPLRNLRFSLEAQVARGCMTVAQLMCLAPGSIVASKTAPGGRMRLMSGTVQIARVSPLVEEGQLQLRVEDMEEE